MTSLTKRVSPSSVRWGVTAVPGRGPLVMDTEVFGADLVPGARLAAVYEPIIVGRPAFISFQTAAELRYGALRRTWGDARMRKLEARTNEAEVVLSRRRYRPPRSRRSLERSQHIRLCGHGRDVSIASVRAAPGSRTLDRTRLAGRPRHLRLSSI